MEALRIGELSRRTGVSVERLRAWERRYRLLRPARSSGGFRLYSPDDEQRVKAMLEHLDRGLAAAEAARAASEGAAQHALPLDATLLTDTRERLRSALDSLDEARAHAALDALFAGFTREAVLSQVILPYLAELGDRWEKGEASVAQEHFASNLIRGRLLALAREWDRGSGPRALLACAPGELHDLPLIIFGLALAGRGWRVSFLGADTPVESIAEAAATLEPAAVVIAATRREYFEAAPGLRDAATADLYIGGAGADEAAAEALGARRLGGDPVGAAAELAGG
jgi:DNA-binding transcriptional MerR regulator